MLQVGTALFPTMIEPVGLTIGGQSFRRLIIRECTPDVDAFSNVRTKLDCDSSIDMSSEYLIGSGGF